MLEAGKGFVKAVGRAGAGVDNIDIAAATKNDVIVLKWVIYILLVRVKNILFFDNIHTSKESIQTAIFNDCV